MKIEMAEKAVKILGGNYTYYYSDCKNFLFIEFHTEKYLLFEDDLKAVKRLLSRNRAHVQYIEASHKGVVIHVSKRP